MRAFKAALLLPMLICSASKEPADSNSFYAAASSLEEYQESTKEGAEIFKSFFEDLVYSPVNLHGLFSWKDLIEGEEDFIALSGYRIKGGTFYSGEMLVIFPESDTREKGSFSAVDKIVAMNAQIVSSNTFSLISSSINEHVDLLCRLNVSSVVNYNKHPSIFSVLAWDSDAAKARMYLRKNIGQDFPLPSLGVEELTQEESEKFFYAASLFKFICSLKLCPDQEKLKLLHIYGQ